MKHVVKSLRNLSPEEFSRLDSLLDAGAPDWANKKEFDEFMKKVKP